MFVLGAFYAALIRWNLLVPDGTHLSADTYNQAFTAHGVIMVFFFLIPSIPAVFGNFFLPLMIGATRPGLPEAQPAELVPLRARRLDHPLRPLHGRARHRLDLLHALQHGLRADQGRDGRARHLRRRLLVDPDRAQLHRDDPQDARPGPDLVPPAALRLGALRDRPHPGARHARDRDHDPAGGGRAGLPPRLLRSRPRRRPDPVPAPLLVLLAPGRLHHDPALDGRRQRDHQHLLAQARSSATASSPCRAWRSR